MKKCIFLTLIFMIGFLFGCSESRKTEDQIKIEFEVETELVNDCNEPSECVVITPGCPLGCNTAVNINEAENLRAVANSLISDYQKDGEICVYTCVQKEATCVNNKCELVNGEN